MRILIAPHGTRGDVQPMIALAIGLRARGHEVRFLVPENFVSWIRSFGFPCESDGVDVEAVFHRPDVDAQSFRSQIRYLRELVPKLFQVTADASAGAEMIIGAGVQPAGMSIADLRGVPYVNALFCPCAVPSATAPPIRWQGLPRWANRLVWRCIGVGADVLLRGPINASRRKLGMPSIRRPVMMLAARPTLVASDPELAPLGSGAPATAIQTDAWILDEPTPLDPRVAAFLDAGPPPVYIGFGSMVASRLDRVVQSIGALAREGTCRLIVAGGWAALDAKLPSSDKVLTIDHAPHRLLFPRAAAVVHHGGAGTTTAGARAGVPQIVLPHLLDQYYWAHRVKELGLGPKAAPVERVTPGLLAACIRQVLDEERFRRAAAAMAERVAPRNGVAAAVAALEGIAGRRATVQS